MYCLTNICYVCLKNKSNLISSANSSVSVKEELRRIIGYHAFNQLWLKTQRIILTCEECYSQLRKTYQFLKMWHKNTALLQGYVDLNTTTKSNTGNEAELHVQVDMKQPDIHDVKREIKLEEDEQIYAFQWEHNIEETEDTSMDFEDSAVKEIIYEKKNVAETEARPTANNSTEIIEETNDAFVNLEDFFVKEENTWKREEMDDTEECPTDNNSTEFIEEVKDVFVNLEDSSVKVDNKRIREEVKNTEEYSMGNNSTESIDNHLQLPVNDNSHLTNTGSVSSDFAGKQMHATNKDHLNIATKKSYKCSICSKTFITKTELNIHTRIHTDNNKSYECAICKKRYKQKGNLVTHMRVHTGEKPYECATCKKCFTALSSLKAHMRVHTGEKPYECAICKKCFTYSSILVNHMRRHTGEKPYECATCKKCFVTRGHLVSHMLMHTGEKPYKCLKCIKCFRHKSNIKSHMRNKHPDENPH